MLYNRFFYNILIVSLIFSASCSFTPLYDLDTQAGKKYPLHDVLLQQAHDRQGQLVYNALYPVSATDRKTANYMLTIKIDRLSNRFDLADADGNSLRRILTYRLKWKMTPIKENKAKTLTGSVTVNKAYANSSSDYTKLVSQKDQDEIVARELADQLMRDIIAKKYLKNNVKHDRNSHK